MTSGGLKRLAEYLWRSVSPAAPTGTTDGELLARFADRGDRDAFAALVDRHGSLVWGVCGRMLQRIHDREEAFQATFLVLARRASAIRQRDSVRSWLYGVAVRVATRARSDVLRRQTEPVEFETQQDGPSPMDEAQLRELREAVDEAVACLPERQRLAVLLAYFEGRTHDEAAQLLGCPRGTIATLLTRARERLRRRLAHRGLASAAGATLFVLQSHAPAAAPALLTASTVGAATAMRLAGMSATSVATAGLVEGVMRSMFMANLKLPAMALAVVLAAGIGVGVFMQPRAEGQPATGGFPGAKTDPNQLSKNEIEQLKEQIRLAEAVLQNARKRIAELDAPKSNSIYTPATGGTTTTPKYGGGLATKPAPSDPLVAPPNVRTSPPAAVGTPPMIGSFPTPDRLRRIEQLAEELRKEVEALRRESRPPAPSTPGTRP